MSQCTRFETEGLLSLEKGHRLDEHFNSCKACAKEKDKYQALKSMISSAGAGSKPDPNWQAEVLSSIKNAKSSKTRNSVYLKYAMIAASFIMVSVIAFIFTQNMTPSSESPLLVTVVAGEKVYRGNTATIGDSLAITFSMSNSKFNQLAVYRDGRPFFSCSNQHCTFDTKKYSKKDAILLDTEKIDNNSIKVVTTLAAIGDYQTILIKSDQPIEFNASSFDQDALKARELGTKVIVGTSIHVR